MLLLPRLLRFTDFIGEYCISGISRSSTTPQQVWISLICAFICTSPKPPRFNTHQQTSQSQDQRQHHHGNHYLTLLPLLFWSLFVVILHTHSSPSLSLCWVRMTYTLWRRLQTTSPLSTHTTTPRLSPSERGYTS